MAMRVEGMGLEPFAVRFVLDPDAERIFNAALSVRR